MTRIEKFAAAALTGILSCPDMVHTFVQIAKDQEGMNDQDIAVFMAWRYADRMEKFAVDRDRKQHDDDDVSDLDETGG